MRRNQGLTVLELLLVISLISVVSAFSAIIYSRFLIENAVLNTVDQLVGEAHKAQTYAMAGRQNGNWGVNFSAPTMTLYLGNSFISRTTAFDEKFTVNSNVIVSGLSDLNFFRLTGTPSSTPTVTITGNNTTKTIIVNSYGMINR